jgi:hypothetical protein
VAATVAAAGARIKAPRWFAWRPSRHIWGRMPDAGIDRDALEEIL